jgi:hypothetical protein
VPLQKEVDGFLQARSRVVYKSGLGPEHGGGEVCLGEPMSGPL